MIVIQRRRYFWRRTKLRPENREWLHDRSSRWLGWPARGVRIGEARNPGPGRFCRGALPACPLPPHTSPPEPVLRALRLLDPIHRAEDCEGVLLLRLWGSSGSNQRVWHGQKCGAGTHWTPFVWQLTADSLALEDTVLNWPQNVPILVSGLRWHSGAEEGVTLFNTGDSPLQC